MSDIKTEREAVKQRVADRLARYLAESNLTQSEFAIKAGVTKLEVSRALSAGTLVGVHVLKRFAKAIDEPLDNLVSIATDARKLKNVSSDKREKRGSSTRRSRPRGGNRG